MSFSSDIKAELCKTRMSYCCAFSECYGMLLFSRTSNENDISFSVECLPAAEEFSRLMRRCFDCRIKIESSGDTRKRYKAYISGEGDRERVLNEYLHTLGCNFESMNQDKFSKSCCVSAFLRGVFLACGTISDPSKQYRIEFVVKSNSLAVELYSLLYRRGINPYMSNRGKYTIVYFKKNEDIEDFLTIINVPKYSLEMMGVTVVKEIRNNTNRKNNFETANIAKASAAAVAQKEAIEKLMQSGKLGFLPKELTDIAKLRYENSDLSLSELLELYNRTSSKALTKSGLNHRLTRIVKISEE